jgi:tRNA-Thr(GGU) m(6)t(6)A37 methyltransferase TsaA
MERIVLEPIGVVHSPRTEIKDDFWGNVVSTIELDGSRFAPEAFLGLKDFSHIEVLFHFHRIREDEVLAGAAHPRGNPNWPRAGIFAMRKKQRPNRIGLSVCELLEVNGLKLKVKALDAIDGTPVLDIKPYVRQFHPEQGRVRQPAWMTELVKDYFA